MLKVDLQILGAGWEVENLRNWLLLRGSKANRAFGSLQGWWDKNWSFRLPRQSELKWRDPEGEHSGVSLILRGFLLWGVCQTCKAAGQKAKILSRRPLKGRVIFWQLYGAKENLPMSRDLSKYARIRWDFRRETEFQEWGKKTEVDQTL